MSTGPKSALTASLPEIAARFQREALQVLALKYRAIASGPLCIWGTSIFGRTVKRILEDLGYGAQLRCFINSFHKPGEEHSIDGMAELAPAEALKAYPQASVLIASDFFGPIEKLARSLAPDLKLCRLVSSHYSNQLEKMLRFYYFTPQDSETPLDVVGDPKDWFAHFDKLSKEGSLTALLQKVSACFADEESRRCLENLFGFYLSGELRLLLESKAAERQYFDPGLYSLGREVYFDCGAFTGDTVLTFSRLYPDYEKIMAFEPDSHNAAHLKRMLEHRQLSGVTLIQAAVSNQTGSGGFIMKGTQGGRLSESEADPSVSLVRLDDYYCARPTLIKMDIEGGELAALQGAEKIIRELRPKLAICVYHRPEDLYTIPCYLKALNPDYHFKLRKHSSTVYETVLYAY